MRRGCSIGITGTGDTFPPQRNFHDQPGELGAIDEDDRRVFFLAWRHHCMPLSVRSARLGTLSRHRSAIRGTADVGPRQPVHDRDHEPAVLVLDAAARTAAMGRGEQVGRA